MGGCEEIRHRHIYQAAFSVCGSNDSDNEQHVEGAMCRPARDPIQDVARISTRALVTLTERSHLLPGTRWWLGGLLAVQGLCGAAGHAVCVHVSIAVLQAICRAVCVPIRVPIGKAILLLRLRLADLRQRLEQRLQQLWLWRPASSRDPAQLAEDDMLRSGSILTAVWQRRLRTHKDVPDAYDSGCQQRAPRKPACLMS